MYAFRSPHLLSLLSFSNNALPARAALRLVRWSSSSQDADNTPSSASASKPIQPPETSCSKVSSASKSTKDADAPLQILQRPLGVRERPTSEPKTWEQTKEELLNQEKRLEKRKALLKEATRGYFTDLNATRRHGGKTWIAPRVLIREDKALYLPDISGTSLDPEVKGSVHTTSLCTGRVSLVSILSSRISELQSANFTSSTYAEFSAHPRFQHVHINLQENLLKSLLVSLFASGIRRSVPHELWKTYFISRQNMDYVRDAMGLDNRHVGYVYLVDERCRIRWAGCADPMPEEAEALRVCTGVLLSRYDEAGAVKRS